MGEKIKGNIPEYRTRSYWESKMPEIEKTLFKKNLMIILLSGIILFSGLFLIDLFFGENTVKNIDMSKNLLLVCGYYLFVLVSLLFFYRFFFQIKRHGGNDPEKTEDVVFRKIESVWYRLHGFSHFSTPTKNRLGKFFPDDMDVCECCLSAKRQNVSTKIPFLRIQLFPCICTYEKKEALENLIHMKEGLTLRKESRVFKVTYKKYSCEVVKIELSENEEYPAHCHYEELVERINIMF